MALLLSCSRLIVVPYFERIISGETTLRAAALDIQLGSMGFQSIYLTYEHGRIAVATVSTNPVITSHVESHALRY